MGIHERALAPHRCAIVLAAGLAWLVLALVAGGPAVTAQEHAYGYSYLRMEFAGQPIANFVHDAKYQGWLQVESVTASRTVADRSGKRKEWAKLPQILVSGRSGPEKSTSAQATTAGWRR
jgi:hypothetical protein